MQQRYIAIGAVAIILIGAVAAFPLWSPYFINDVVDEAFPELTTAQRDGIREMTQGQQDVLVEMADDNMEMAEDTAVAMMEDDTTMDEDMPEEMPDSPTILSEGTFNEFDPVHAGEGTATIYELPDGSRVLRLEDFAVTNGPQLHVILARNTPSTIFDGNGDYIDLGALKGNIGNQNYAIPDDVDLSDVTGVVIYCVPFQVNFSVAAFES